MFHFLCRYVGHLWVLGTWHPDQVDEHRWERKRRCRLCRRMEWQYADNRGHKPLDVWSN